MLNPNIPFTIVAPLSSISRRTRLYKLAIFLYDNNITAIKHIGWERIRGENKEPNFDFQIQKRIILRGGGYGGGKIKLMYFAWMFLLFFYGFTLKRNQNVWALGFESAFPLLLASKIKGFKLYFDDADRFSMLFNYPILVQNVIKRLEKITSRHVYKHIIPVKERYEFNSKKFNLFPNIPSKSEILKAKQIVKTISWIQAKLVINVNGWLGKNRGMSQILELSNIMKDDSIAFILAGKLDCKEAKELATKQNVQYLGVVSNAETLASYLVSDFVFTYYDPKQEINTLAASNKWGDAIHTETGIIVNSEVITANYFREKNICISQPYHDTTLLATELRNYLNATDKIKAIKNRTSSISEALGFFETQLKNVLEKENKEL